MIVYCEDSLCRHNKDGICENHFSIGVEAVSMVVTLGGDVICSDQDDIDEYQNEE